MTAAFRAQVLLLLLARQGNEPEPDAAGGATFLPGLSTDPDARVAYYAAARLCLRLPVSRPSWQEQCRPQAPLCGGGIYAHQYRLRMHRRWRAGLRQLLRRAQEADDERLLENPFFRYHGIAQQSGVPSGAAPATGNPPPPRTFGGWDASAGLLAPPARGGW